MTCGIYKLTVSREGYNPVFYVGQSVNIERRRADHLKTLRGSRHYNRRLQAVFNKYGPGSVRCDTVLVCKPETLTLYEQIVFDHYAAEFGQRSLLNIQRECVSSGFGLKRSPEIRAKLSAAKRGKPGRVWTPEQIAKLRATKAGTRPTPECIALSAAARTGKRLSVETRAKMSMAQKKRKATPETRRKMSEAALRREARRRVDTGIMLGSVDHEVVK